MLLPSVSLTHLEGRKFLTDILLVLMPNLLQFYGYQWNWKPNPTPNNKMYTPNLPSNFPQEAAYLLHMAFNFVVIRGMCKYVNIYYVTRLHGLSLWFYVFHPSLQPTKWSFHRGSQRLPNFLYFYFPTRIQVFCYLLFWPISHQSQTQASFGWQFSQHSGTNFRYMELWFESQLYWIFLRMNFYEHKIECKGNQWTYTPG